MADALYDDADLYDLVSPPDATMLDYYVAEGGPGRRVLDLGCGTGRFTIPLARSGAAVVGLDLSQTMLEKARLAAREAGEDIAFHHADMRYFALDGTFDTILLAANSVMHLHTHADFAAVFGCVARHLAPGGRFLFDVFVPSLTLLASDPDSRQPVGHFRHETWGDVRIEETIHYDAATQIMRSEWFWSRFDGTIFRRTTLELRQIFPQELPLLLSLGGLTLTARHGDFDRSAFGAGSWRQVCVATAGR